MVEVPNPLILAVDPGCDETAWLLFCAPDEILAFEKEANEEFLARFSKPGLFETNERMINPIHLAIEMVASYGMPVGREIFETCVFIGRVIERWGQDYKKVYRKDVKLHLCGQPSAKDSNIRQALVDRFGPPGTKKSPGKTYGISKDVWSALAIAVTFAEGAAK